MSEEYRKMWDELALDLGKVCPYLEIKKIAYQKADGYYAKRKHRL